MMKNLFDKPWKIWTGVGIVVTTAVTIGYTFAPVDYKIAIDNVYTLLQPLIQEVTK